MAAATQEQRQELKKREQEQEQCEFKVENGQREGCELESKSGQEKSSLAVMQQNGKNEREETPREHSGDNLVAFKPENGSNNNNKWLHGELKADATCEKEKFASTLQQEKQKGEQYKGSLSKKDTDISRGKSKENNDMKPTQEHYWNDGGNNDIRNMAPSVAAMNSETIEPVSAASAKELTSTRFVEQTSGHSENFSDKQHLDLEESMTTASSVVSKKSIDRNCEESCFVGLEGASVEQRQRQEQSKENTCSQMRKVLSATTATITTQPVEPARCLLQQVEKNNGQGDGNACPSELQRSARQAELLQLIRQRQQQLAINSSRSSQELPTLQQLQQQIQQQRSNLPSSQQQQRMQQWTEAAAAMVQQQQQQQRQQQQQQHNESLRSNATPVPSATAATTATTLEMELEQTRAAQIPAQALTTTATRPNHLSQPHLPLNISIQQELESHNTNHLQQQQYSVNSNIISQLKECDVRGEEEERNCKSSFREPHSNSKQPVKVMHRKQSQNLLTTALDCGSNARMVSPDLPTTTPNLLVGNSEKQVPTPTPTPRLSNPQQQQQQQQQVNNCFQTELSILTSTPTNNACGLPLDLKNTRLRELPSVDSINQSPATSAQSTPSHSILSDSTTLITEAAMNSCELIPKLIERLDRKLIVMKEEQLSLLREIELNETAGQRLFQYMKQHLTVNEYEKISLHANEIEKVTKLILSLKSRLKKVELELKERAKLNSIKSKQQRDQSQSIKSTLPIDDETQQYHQQQSGRNINSSQQEKSIIATAGKQSVRGVSDPTSTIGLPKRNHQHHASLQLTSSTTQPSSSSCASSVAAAAAAASATTAQISADQNRIPISKTNTAKADHRTVTDASSFIASRHDRHHQLSLTSSSGGCSSGNESRSSRVSSPTRNQSSDQGCCDVGSGVGVGVGQQDCTKAASSTSSDSIFNCADSAIGSTITGHGGSVTNFEQPTVSQSSLTSNSSTTSSHHTNHHQNNLSSTISVSSHSSMSTSSSVPNSPQLVSPVNTSSSHHQDHDNEHHHLNHHNLNLNRHLNNHNHNHDHQIHQFQRGSSKTPIDSSNVSLNNSDSNNNSDSMVHLLTDADILMAKRNKLVSQLEEAHQLEECIVRRNNIIIERILKKYFSEAASFNASSGAHGNTLPGNREADNEDDAQNSETNNFEMGAGGEIAEFKQYTRLKSLLLKDTHDIADRIDSAVLQLNELKQTNHQRVA